MRFQIIDRAKKEFPVHRLCRVLGVSQSGYFAWKDRPASRRQRDDMVMLAHVRSAFALSNGTYGSPRMTRELQDDGFAIGRRRTARLMRENVEVLMDRTSEDAEHAARDAIARAEPGVELRRLRVRSAAGRHFVDAVVGVPPDSALGEGHAIADSIEDAICAALPGGDVVVHVEPGTPEGDLRVERVAAAVAVVAVVVAFKLLRRRRR